MEIQNRFLTQQIAPRRFIFWVLESGHGQESVWDSAGSQKEDGQLSVVPEVVASILAGPIGPITGGGAITGLVMVWDAIL